jgi:hypothetical protein
MVTGKALTAILHLINQTPFDWFCKRQATVETATYGAEFDATRVSVEQIADIRWTLLEFGAPIKGKTFLFGDNKSMITNSTLPHSQLNKRHMALSYHKVREAVARGLISYHHISRDKNPADILSKHWGYPQVRYQLKSLLDWAGETSIIPAEVATKETKEVNKHVRTRGECYDATHTASSVVHLVNATHITPDVWIMDFPSHIIQNII